MTEENPLREDPTRKSDFALKKLSPDDDFCFKCHPGVSCFTECCKGIKIILTPFDVLQLKTSLKITSDEFLARYTRFSSIKDTDVPLVLMKMDEDEPHGCPMLGEGGVGCTVYEQRPTVCRYYPVGFASFNQLSASEPGGSVFLMREAMCKGHEEKPTWQAHTWLEDQGTPEYDALNQPWLEIVARLKSVKVETNDDRKMQTFIMASYDVDTFRRFVFDSSFLSRFVIPDDEVESIRNDDRALLKFGFRWLQYALFKEGELRPATDEQAS